jgi:hypothetical protein
MKNNSVAYRQFQMLNLPTDIQPSNLVLERKLQVSIKIQNNTLSIMS